MASGVPAPPTNDFKSIENCSYQRGGMSTGESKREAALPEVGTEPCADGSSSGDVGAEPSYAGARQPLEAGTSTSSGFDGDERWQDSPETSSADPLPSPSHQTLQILFGIMGMGVLFPYNALITCVDYFSVLHPEESDVSGQLAASCLTALLVATILLLPLASSGDSGNETGVTERQTSTKLGFASPVRRVLVGFVLVLALLVLLSIPYPRNPSMTVLNALSFLVGTADAISQSGLYVFAASYHVPSYSAAVTFGSAAAGLAVSFLRLVTRGFFRTDTVEGLRKGASVLFGMSCVVILVCLWALWIAVRDRGAGPEGNRGTDMQEEREIQLTQIGHDQESGGSRERQDRHLRRFPALDEVPASTPIDGAGPSEHSPVLLTSPMGDPTSAMSSHREEPHHQSSYSLINQIKRRAHLEVYTRTIRITWKPTISAFLNFFITLSLFPGTVTSIKSAMPSDDGGFWSIRLGDWLPAVLIATFNGADCAGRALLSVERIGIAKVLLESQHWDEVVPGGNSRLGGDGQTTPDGLSEAPQPLAGPSSLRPKHRVKLINYDVMIWYQTWARIVFYPLLAACVLPKTPHPIIASDFARIIIVFVFGLTNGFVQTANFMVTPTMLHDEPSRDASSLLLLLSIYTGLMAGAYFGLVVDATLSSLQ